MRRAETVWLKNVERNCKTWSRVVPNTPKINISKPAPNLTVIEESLKHVSHFFHRFFARANAEKIPHDIWRLLLLARRIRLFGAVMVATASSVCLPLSPQPARLWFSAFASWLRRPAVGARVAWGRGTGHRLGTLRAVRGRTRVGMDGS
jgi:hypothetical protein